MKRFYEALGRAEMVAAKYALLALATLVFAAAVARTFRRPINWAIDLATFLFAWCVFLGGDIAMRRDRLFSISLLTGKLPAKARFALMIFNYAVIFSFCLGMVFYGVKLTLFTRQRTFQGIPGFSYSWVTISVPIGCALMAMSSLAKVKEFIKAMRGDESRAEQGEVGSEII